jgi:hypothetical protein
MGYDLRGLNSKFIKELLGPIALSGNGMEATNPGGRPASAPQTIDSRRFGAHSATASAYRYSHVHGPATVNRNCVGFYLHCPEFLFAGVAVFVLAGGSTGLWAIWLHSVGV